MPLNHEDDIDIDVALSSRSTETTQLENKIELQGINTELDAQTAKLSNRTQKTIITDGTFDHVFSDVGGVKALQIEVIRTVSAVGSGVSQSDNSPVVLNSTAFAPVGGMFNDSAPAITSGQGAYSRMTPNRAIHVNPRNSTGTEILPATSTNQNPLDKYRIADEDSIGLAKYYGFASSTSAGMWIILKQDTTTAPYTYRYANVSNNATRTDYGAAGATGAWANRTTLVYSYLYLLTGV